MWFSAGVRQTLFLLKLTIFHTMRVSFSEAQIQQIKDWASQGLRLAEIQSHIAQHLKVRLTYLDTRFLIDDLSVELKESREKATRDTNSASIEQSPTQFPHYTDPHEEAKGTHDTLLKEEKVSSPGVTIRMDRLKRPGKVASGSVTFSDGGTAEWQIDALGQLGLIPKKEGYQPPAADLPEFQLALQKEFQMQEYEL